MTRLSNGVCIIPRPALQYYCGTDMTIRSFYPTFPWELCMIFKKNAYISRAVQTLISFIQNEFAQMDVPYGLKKDHTARK
jgi:DNA-binding transcriptional LysR family regulator